MASDSGESKSLKLITMVAIVAFCAICFAPPSVQCNSFAPTMASNLRHMSHVQKQHNGEQLEQFGDEPSMMVIDSADPTYDLQRANSEQTSRNFARALIKIMMSKPLTAGDDRYSGFYPSSIDLIDTKRSYYKPCSVNPVSCFGGRRRR